MSRVGVHYNSAGENAIIYGGLALFVTVGLVAILLKPKPALASSGGARQGKTLPWVPPALSSMVPTLAKSRDTSTTAFPIDEWIWTVADGSRFFLVVASDDPTSYVALSDTPDNSVPKILQMGPGQLSVQIAAQL